VSKIVAGVDGMGRPRRVLDERGKQYGRLVVVALADRQPGRNTHWICKCRCGQTATVGGAQLRDGSSTSCGCYWKEISRAGCNRLAVNEAAFRRALGKVKGGATKRRLIWTLTDGAARSLMTSDCHYCGAEPARISVGVNGFFKWNGLDQKTPNAGYTLENCVPCCFECNRIKLNIPYERFLEKCKRIAARFEDIEPLAKQSEAIRSGR
jgi:hypothetical protein